MATRDGRRTSRRATGFLTNAGINNQAVGLDNPPPLQYPLGGLGGSSVAEGRDDMSSGGNGRGGRINPLGARSELAGGSSSFPYYRLAGLTGRAGGGLARLAGSAGSKRGE